MFRQLRHMRILCPNAARQLISLREHIPQLHDHSPVWEWCRQQNSTRRFKVTNTSKSTALMVVTCSVEHHVTLVGLDMRLVNLLWC
ncbi:hypothetical protein FKM82_004186 [Ascaphus truei]